MTKPIINKANWKTKPTFHEACLMQNSLGAVLDSIMITRSHEMTMRMRGLIGPFERVADPNNTMERPKRAESSMHRRIAPHFGPLTSENINPPKITAVVRHPYFL
jgi:hypothetical protein